MQNPERQVLTKADETTVSPLRPFEHLVDEDEQEEDEVPLLHHTYQYVFEDTTTERRR